VIYTEGKFGTNLETYFIEFTGTHYCTELFERPMFGESHSAHLGLGKVALLIGILATIVTAVAFIGKKRGEGRQIIPLEGWEDELSA
jgi:hypothetical protein